MAHGELTCGMAPGGHILSGNQEIVRTDRLTPVTGLYPIQAHYVGGLDSVAGPRPEQCLHHQWNTVC